MSQISFRRRFIALLTWTLLFAPVANAASEPTAEQKTPTISLSTKGRDILDVLNAIARVSKRNIVADAGVTGTVSVKFRNVPWEQALETVLKKKGLGRQDAGSIIRIAPLSVLAEEEKSGCVLPDGPPPEMRLKVRLIPVNYRSAEDVVPKVRELLSERGTLTVDTRTNVLIIKEVVEVLTKAELLVREHDHSVPRVSFDVRVVELSRREPPLELPWGAGVETIEGHRDDRFPSIKVGVLRRSTELAQKLSDSKLNHSVNVLNTSRAVVWFGTEAAFAFGAAPLIDYSSKDHSGQRLVDAFVSMHVASRALPDGALRLELRLDVVAPTDAVTGSSQIAPVTIPVTSVIVRLQPGDSVVIGGIGVRVSDVPSRSGREDQAAETLTFITPQVLPPTELAATSSPAE